LLPPLLGLRNPVPDDLELFLSSPLPRHLFGGLTVFVPPSLDPLRDDFLDAGDHDIFEVG
jgi:hypothetical protein